jgi:putative SOS response-associated peptidase YedK
MRWGLVPFWAKEVRIGAKMINARAETVAEMPAFRGAFAVRRCLLRPCSAKRLALYEVSVRVNSHVNDDPACLDPLRTLFDHGLDGAGAR